MPKGLYIAGGAVVVATVAFVAAAGLESRVDAARKPELADFIVRDSLARCEIDAPHWIHPEGYERRLTDVLMRTRTSALDHLKDNHITVCLDQRLAGEQYGFLGSPPGGIFYPSPDGYPVLSLWDNGAGPDDRGFLQSTAATEGPAYLQAFKEHFNRLFASPTPVQGEAAPLYAYTYTVPVQCGQNCTTYVTEYDWKRGGFAGFGNFMQDHPALQAPPLELYALR